VKPTLSTLGVNQRLALLALILGLVALFATPTRGSRVTIDPEELSLIVAKEADHVRVQDLADWIIAGRSDYRLIDLRDERSYAEYHIPTAENVPLASLLDRGLARNEKIVLYSDGGIHAAQAWFLLVAGGFKGVYTLFGGLDEWKDEILFPRLAENPTPQEAARDAKIREISLHFGGRPLTGAAAAAEASRPLPKVDLPAMPSGPKPAARKRKEGC
jgi:rhodanese-related sulfurtransferase